jgi:hypothetical protein
MKAVENIYILIKREERVKADAFCIFLRYLLGFNSPFKSTQSLHNTATTPMEKYRWNMGKCKLSNNKIGLNAV